VDDYSSAIADVLKDEKSAPHFVPVSFCMMLFRELIFAATLDKCFL